MSPKSTDVALKLCLNRTAQYATGQNSSLLLAETWDGQHNQNDNYEVIDKNGHFKLQVYPVAYSLNVAGSTHGDVQDSNPTSNIHSTSEWQIKDDNAQIVVPEVGRMVMVERVQRLGSFATATFTDYVFVGARSENGSVRWKMLPWAL